LLTVRPDAAGANAKPLKKVLAGAVAIVLDVPLIVASKAAESVILKIDPGPEA